MYHPRWRLSSKCGSSAPRSHRRKAVLSPVALTPWRSEAACFSLSPGAACYVAGMPLPLTSLLGPLPIRRRSRSLQDLLEAFAEKGNEVPLVEANQEGKQDEEGTLLCLR